MRKVIYAGSAFYTGDRLAEALLEYANLLAHRDMSETVYVPGRTPDGVRGDIEVLIGPASQLLSEPTDEEFEEIVDEEVVRKFLVEIEKLRPARPRMETPESQAETEEAWRQSEYGS